MAEVTKKKLEKLNAILNSVDIVEIDTDKEGLALSKELTDRDTQIRTKLTNRIQELGDDGGKWIQEQIDEITKSSTDKLNSVQKSLDELSKKYTKMITDLAKKQIEIVASKFTPGLVSTVKTIKDIAEKINEMSTEATKNIQDKVVNAQIDISITIDKQLAKIINAQIPKNYKKDNQNK